MKSQKRLAAELVVGIAWGDEPMPAVVPYIPSKTEVSDRERTALPRSTPSRHGLSSQQLVQLLHALEEEPRAHVHSIAVLRDGELLCSASAPGYDGQTYHLAHSMSKTLTGMAVGLLMDEGKLSVDTHLTDIFPDYRPVDPRFPEITVRHLLTMTSGIGVNEMASVTSTRWTEDAFAAPLRSAPGETFAYNSINSYLLSHIVKRVTGEGLLAYLTPRLFHPMGITNVFWEKSPEGIEKGGWGAYLSVTSWAKLGTLMANGGRWHGEQLLSAAFVTAATTDTVTNPNTESDFDYGYQLWVSRDKQELLFNGMLGQNVWIHPQSGTVVAMSAGNNELFHQSPALSLVRSHLRDAEVQRDRTPLTVRQLRAAEAAFFTARCPVTPLASPRGFTYRLGLRQRPFPQELTPLLGHYVFRRNGVGLLPLFVRLMQNNYQGGLESLLLERVGERLFLTAREGGIDRRVEVGLYGFVETVLDLCGERYLVRTLLQMLPGEGRCGPHYRLLLVFPELPDIRLIDLSREEDGRMRVAFSELPDQAIAEVYLNRLPQDDRRISMAIAMLDGRFGRGFIPRTLERSFHPVLMGIDTAQASWRQQQAAEEARAAADRRTAEELIALLDTFLPEEGAPTVTSAPKKLLGLLGMFLSRDKGERPEREPTHR